MNGRCQCNSSDGMADPGEDRKLDSGVLRSWGNLASKRGVAVEGGIGSCSHFRLQGNDTRPPVIIANQVYAVGTAPLIRVENALVEFHGWGHFEGPNLLQKSNGGSLTPNSTWNDLPIT